MKLHFLGSTEIPPLEKNDSPRGRETHLFKLDPLSSECRDYALAISTPPCPGVEQELKCLPSRSMNQL